MRPIACTMPVNIVRSSLRQHARDHAQVVADALARRATRRASRAASDAQRRLALEHAARRVAEQRRREVEQQLVDEPRVEQRAVELRAGLDVQFVDAAPRERVHQRRQVDAAAARPAAASDVDVAGHAGLRSPAVTISALPRGEHARRRRRLPVPVDDDAQRLPRRRDIARTVSCGSSCSTVPTPVRIAQARARHAWPSARAAAPVIHWLSPFDERRAAVEAGGELHAHPRPAARHARDEADVEFARLVLAQAEVDVDAGRAQAVAAMRLLRIGIAHRGDDARDAGGQDRVDARRRAAVALHGSSVTYSVAPRGSWPRARASASAFTSACGSPARSWKPSPITDAILDDDAADARIGRRRVQPCAASASARAMYSRSACVCSVMAIDPIRDWRHVPPSIVRQRVHRNTSAAGAWARRRRLDFLQRVAEIRDVLERAVHRGEADVGDLVELVQLLHHHLADLPRRDLALAERQHLLHDAVDRRVDVLGRHRPLVQRALEADADLRDIEVRAVAVGLDHLRQAQLDGLVGGEALLAGDAAPAPANRIAGLGHARVDDLRVGAAAEGTFHFSDSVAWPSAGSGETSKIPAPKTGCRSRRPAPRSRARVRRRRTAGRGGSWPPHES